jgi:hypothetical protein
LLIAIFFLLLHLIQTVAMDYDRSRLALFLKRTLENNKQTAKDFAASYVKADGKKGLNESIISRILNEKIQANRETLRKIAVTALKRENASVEELLQRTNLDDEAAENWDPLKIGSGFTTWSAYVLALVNTRYDDTIKDSLMGTQFVFCDQGVGDKREPYWVQEKKDIEQLRIHPELFKHKYISEELYSLLLENKIDCALLLRKTFEEMKFSEEKKPILVSRILVGSGTSMYVVQKNGPNKVGKNEIVPIPDYDSLGNIKKDFCDSLNGKRVKILILDNASILEDKAKLLGDTKVAAALTGLRGQDTIRRIDEGEYNDTIERLGEELVADPDQDDSQKNRSIEVLLIIGFAPLNHLIFQELQSRVPGLYYKHYNLSKMVDVKASYGLYARPDVLEGPSKLKKIRDFLVALEHYVVKMKTKENLIKDISTQFSDLYYRDDSSKDGEINNFERMNKDLEELEYSNSSLELVKKIVNLLDRKIRF